MAKTVWDLALLMDVMQGQDLEDPPSRFSLSNMRNRDFDLKSDSSPY